MSADDVRRKLDLEIERHPPDTLARHQAELRRELLLLWLASPIGRLGLWLAERRWRRWR